MDDLIERELDQKKQEKEEYVIPMPMDTTRSVNLQHLL